MKLFSIILIPFILFSCATTKKQMRFPILEEARDPSSYLFYEKDKPISFAYRSLQKCNKNTKVHMRKLQKKALKSIGDNNYWNQVGICHFLSKNYSKAFFYFEMALKKASKKASASIYNNMGVAHLNLKHYRRALHLFQKATGANPNSLIPKLNMAHLYINFNQHYKAKKILKALQRRHKKNTDIKRALATVNKMEKQK